MTEPQIQSIHRLYEQLSGMSVPLTFPRHAAWTLFAAAGHTEEDLRLVIALLKDKIRRQGKTIACLRFSLITNLEWFAEDLAEARAMARVPARTAKQRVLEATGRREPEPETVKTAAQVLKGIAAHEQWLRLRDSL